MSERVLRASPSRARIAFALGIILLVAAIAFVAKQASSLDSVWESARSSPWWLVTAALLLPLANYAVVSLSFWVQVRRLGPVPLWEMAALIGMAWLINFLPMRMGMVSRIAYHRTYHGIGVAASARVMIIGMSCGALSVLAAIGAMGIVGVTATRSVHAIALAAPIVVGALASLALQAWRGRGYLGIVFILRYLDFAIWTVRYLVVFAIIGKPIPLMAAIAISAVCQLALNVPIAGNGLGLREWAVGVVGAHLPAGLLSSTGAMTTAAGLAADLVNRAAEVLLAPMVGLISVAVLFRRIQAMRRGNALESAASGDPPSMQ